MTIKEFIEEYNKRIDWNIEIAKEISGSLPEENMYKDIIDDCLNGEKIDPEDIEPHSVEIFEEETEEYFEMHFFSIKECQRVYHFLTKGESKKEYKKKKMRVLFGELKKIVENNEKVLEEVKKSINDAKSLFHALRNMAPVEE